jgi:hypothetical protein
MNINDVTVGLRYIDIKGIEVEIVALPGKLKSFQCTTSDRPGKVLKITARQLSTDLITARQIIR